MRKKDDNSARKVILYIAMSLDGYISQKNDDLTFLSAVDRVGEDYGYGDFISTIDTIISGRKTYDWVINHIGEYPHSDKDSYIITRTPHPDKGNLKFYSGELKSLITKLKSENGRDIFVEGGAEIVNELLKDNLIDEYYISIVPVLIGDGIRLFNDGRPEQKLTFLEARQYESGLVMLHYIR